MALLHHFPLRALGRVAYSLLTPSLAVDMGPVRQSFLFSQAAEEARGKEKMAWAFGDHPHGHKAKHASHVFLSKTHFLGARDYNKEGLEQANILEYQYQGVRYLSIAIVPQHRLDSDLEHDLYHTNVPLLRMSGRVIDGAWHIDYIAVSKKGEPIVAEVWPVTERNVQAALAYGRALTTQIAIKEFDFTHARQAHTPSGRFAEGLCRAWAQKIRARYLQNLQND